MNEASIIKMLKEIVSEIDYDLYKEMFIYEHTKEDQKQYIENLVSVVKKDIWEIWQYDEK